LPLRHVCQTIPCVGTIGCTCLQNHEEEMGTQHQKAFAMAKKVIAKETLLAYPDFNKLFQIHADASQCRLGAVVSQEGKPIAFHGRKLNPAQTRCTATERELVSTVETLKEHCNMLLGQTIKVFTDHNNPVHEPKCKTLPSSAPHMDVAWSVLA